ncbi:hypothetical protein M501DRAFT_1012153 [Patellaria atrata CBS 101060]|uniref:Uncharacterized protein n=1 Tax=Patellaria atrata CBS 101060 TaxID=1346257 RepID=A0A9P4SHS8_9PEZI|nr:hypothetical protein M501DRAFT_1012153 [Patellaria atrata CBS 101060]
MSGVTRHRVLHAHKASTYGSEEQKSKNVVADQHLYVYTNNRVQQGTRYFKKSPLTVPPSASRIPGTGATAAVYCSSSSTSPSSSLGSHLTIPALTSVPKQKKEQTRAITATHQSKLNQEVADLDKLIAKIGNDGEIEKEYIDADTTTSLFNTNLTSTWTCSNCHTTHSSPVTGERILSFAIDTPSTGLPLLSSCITSYTRETVDTRCDSCKKSHNNLQRTQHILSAPEVLFLQFKLFRTEQHITNRGVTVSYQKMQKAPIYGP